MIDFFKNRRRRKLREQPFPVAWRRHIERNAPLCAALLDDRRRELEELVQVLLAEKNFEGCGGLEMTDEIRVSIAAQACLLLIGRQTDIYPQVQSVLVYPTTFVPRVVEQNDDGVVEEYDDPLDGEAWDTGAVILAWDDVLYAAEDRRDGYNVVIHEFAHQVDLENGNANGMPHLPDEIDSRKWAETFGREYEQLCRDVDRGRHTFLDDYGADDPAEFFAVAVESYFVRPEALAKQHPELFARLREFFG